MASFGQECRKKDYDDSPSLRPEWLKKKSTSCNAVVSGQSSSQGGLILPGRTRPTVQSQDYQHRNTSNYKNGFQRHFFVSRGSFIDEKNDDAKPRKPELVISNGRVEASSRINNIQQSVFEKDFPKLIGQKNPTPSNEEKDDKNASPKYSSVCVSHQMQSLNNERPKQDSGHTTVKHPVSELLRPKIQQHFLCRKNQYSTNQKHSSAECKMQVSLKTSSGGIAGENKKFTCVMKLPLTNSKARNKERKDFFHSVREQAAGSENKNVSALPTENNVTEVDGAKSLGWTAEQENLFLHKLGWDESDSTYIEEHETISFCKKHKDALNMFLEGKDHHYPTLKSMLIRLGI